MKKSLFFVMGLLCLIFSPLQAQKPIEKVLKSIKPPNCIPLEANIFMDRAEISNLHWLEYLAYLEKNQPEQYEANLPDTTCWANELAYNDSYVANYLRYPGFHHFPVVGVSYQQVLDYCKWRSKVVTKNFTQHKKNKYKDYDIEFIFKLPSIEQWEKAAQGNINDLYGFKELKPKEAKHNYYRANHLRTDSLSKHLNGVLITEYILAYSPNALGFYNMIGNVAEMVTKEGVAKEGSWQDPLEDCAINKQKTYERPESWVGFRCICEVKITPKNPN